MAHKNYIIKGIVIKFCTNSNKTLFNIVLKYPIDQCNIFGDMSLIMIERSSLCHFKAFYFLFPNIAKTARSRELCRPLYIVSLFMHSYVIICQQRVLVQISTLNKNFPLYQGASNGYGRQPVYSNTVADIINATLLFWLYLERENKKL